MTGSINELDAKTHAMTWEQASKNFSVILSHVARLFSHGGASSIAAHEAEELAKSVYFVLGIVNATPEEAAIVLSTSDALELWHKNLRALDIRIDQALDTWQEIVVLMPPLRNVALRDTLESLGNLRSSYDIYFAAHEVPCVIDYQLSSPVDPSLMGIDYIEAWLDQLLIETRWIAQFDSESCIYTLERICPDYRGLHVNLFDLLRPFEKELAPKRQTKL